MRIDPRDDGGEKASETTPKATVPSINEARCLKDDKSFIFIAFCGMASTEEPYLLPDHSKTMEKYGVVYGVL